MSDYSPYDSPIESPKSRRQHHSPSAKQTAAKRPETSHSKHYQLEPHEQLLRVVHPHWTSLLPGVPFFVGVLATPIVVWRLGFLSLATTTLIVLAIGLFAGATILFALLSLRANQMIITSRRVIFRNGLFDHELREVPLMHITNMKTHHDLGQELIGTGTLSIDIGGANGPEVLPNVKHPEDLVELLAHGVDEWSFALEESGSAAVADAVRDPSMSRLRELAQLRTNGMITEEEFTIAKRHIFKELRP